MSGAVFDPTDLPSGYLCDARAGETLCVHQQHAVALAAAGYVWGGGEVGEESDLAGREPLRELRTSGGSFLIRRFTHGGLLRRFTGKRFGNPDRPFEELRLSAALRDQGLPTPLVVAARARKLLMGWELELVTERLPGTVDLGTWLGRARRGEASEGTRRALLVAFGRMVGRLHGAGFWHADLQPNNFLARESDPTADPFVLDLDRSRFQTMAPTDCHAQLARLFRHVEDREVRFGRALRRSDLWRFLRAYGGGKADWRAVAEIYERKKGAHRLGKRVEIVLAPDRSEHRHG